MRHIWLRGIAGILWLAAAIVNALSGLAGATLLYAALSAGLRQVLFAKRVPVKQEVKPPVAVWLEQTVR